MPDLDQLLSIIAIGAWVLFTVYAVTVFVRSFLREGPAIAMLRLISARVLVPLLLVIGLNLLSASLVFVDPTQVGVVISVVAPGGVQPQPMRAGLHFIIPLLEHETKYSTAWQTYTMSGAPSEGQAKGDDSIRARTSNGQEVRIDSSIIFRINQEQVVTLHMDWQTRYVEDFVRPVIRGLVRTQVSQFTVQEVNSSARKDLETTLERLLREKFAAKGLLVDQFLLRDITFSDEYATAIEEKQVALEGQDRTAHEAQQIRNLAEGERDKLTIIAQGRSQQFQLEAEGRAKAKLTEADAQAKALDLIGAALAKNPNLLTYEYIDKLSPNIRAMLVPNNAPYILPLPDLNQFMSPTATLTATQASTATQTLTKTAASTTTVSPASALRDDKVTK